MNESDKTALYLVPYAPEKKKFTFFKTFFFSRKRVYLLFSAFFTAFFFFGYALAQRYDVSDIAVYISYFKKWLPIMTLFAYISSFTIFSPVFAIFIFSYISAYLAFVFSYSSYVSVFSISVIIIMSVIYFTELYFCFFRAKYGIKRIFRAECVISFSAMTVMFLLSTLLCFGMI